MRLALLAVVAGLAWATAAVPAAAQREAISPSLSPEAAASAFEEMVTSACLPAAAGAGVSGLPQALRGRLQASSDPETRRQSGAAADENVWDVGAAKGVVAIHEKSGRCVVSVYGPPAMATIVGLAQKLTGGPFNFERLAAAPPPNGFGQSLMKVENGKRMMVTLRGSEPGMPGHQSQFSVVTATVFATPAG